MAPFGARGAYQLMIAPRVCRMRFEDPGPSGAAMIHDALRRLAEEIAAMAGHAGP